MCIFCIFEFHLILDFILSEENDSFKRISSHWFFIYPIDITSYAIFSFSVKIILKINTDYLWREKYGLKVLVELISS